MRSLQPGPDNFWADVDGDKMEMVMTTRLWASFLIVLHCLVDLSTLLARSVIDGGLVG